jgi:hypothetical protein
MMSRWKTNTMALRTKNKEAVKIDDWHRKNEGTLIGWINATSETPPSYNGEAFRYVYAPHRDSNERWLTKFIAPLGRFLFDAFGDTRFFEVSDDIYAKSAIEGFPDGTTLDNVKKDDGTPDKVVILRNAIGSKRDYFDAYGPGNSEIEKTKDELQEKINSLQQELEAEEDKTHELEQQVDRDEGSSNSRNDRWGPEPGMREDEYQGENY